MTLSGGFGSSEVSVIKLRWIEVEKNFHLHQSSMSINALDSIGHFPITTRQELRRRRICWVEEGDVVETICCWYNVEVRISAFKAG